MRTGPQFKSVEPHLLRQLQSMPIPILKRKAMSGSGCQSASITVCRQGCWTGLTPLRSALHFATCNAAKYGEDGAVWMVNYKKVHEYLPPALLGIVKEENTWILTTEILERMFKGLHDLMRRGGRKEIL